MIEQDSRNPYKGRETSQHDPRLLSESLKFIEASKQNGNWGEITPEKQQIIDGYLLTESATFKTLASELGVKEQVARRLYFAALKSLWEASSPEVQEQFDSEEIMKAKKPGLGKGFKHSPETLAKIKSKSHRGEQWDKAHAFKRNKK